MKRIWFLSTALLLAGAPAMPAQDAATQERLDKLSGQIEDLVAGQKEQQKQIQAILKEVENLREQSAKPTVAYASQEDLKNVAEAVKEVDRKRLEDFEKIRTELQKLGRTISQAAPPPRRTPPTETTDKTSDKGFEYIVKKGDTLSLIVQAYRENNIKITTDQVLKANPGLKPEKMHVGQKIFIPAPQP